MDLKFFTKKMLKDYGDINPKVGYLVYIGKGKDCEFYEIGKTEPRLVSNKFLALGAFRINKQIDNAKLKHFKRKEFCANSTDMTAEAICERFHALYDFSPEEFEKFKKLSKEEQIEVYCETIYSDVQNKIMLLDDLLCCVGDSKLHDRYNFVKHDE